MTSGVAERLHSTLSAANSIAALLPGRQSEGLDGGTSLLEDNHDNQPNGHLVFTECTLETYAKVIMVNLYLNPIKLDYSTAYLAS